MKRPNYGLDSPAIVSGLFVASVVFFSIGLLFPHFFHLPMRWIGIIMGAYFLQGAVGMVYYSKVGKLRMQEAILDSIPWRGDEQVLDVGCGRGLLMVAAARRLTTGCATGVDVWLPNAITGNHPNAALENATLEGVRERVRVEKGDVRELPFPDSSFDIVVSNFVVHEVNTDADREKLVSEMARVLKPNGYVALRDFIFTDVCVEHFRRHGVENATRQRVGTLGFWIGAILNFGFFQLYQVNGKKAPLTHTL